MSTVRQIWIITLVAVVGFFGLRSLPDTQCTFLHADHQPVVVDGLERMKAEQQSVCHVSHKMTFWIDGSAPKLGHLQSCLNKVDQAGALV